MEQQKNMRRQNKKSFIVYSWIFIILLSVSGITCLDYVLELRYHRMDWTRCFGYEAVCERFQGVGFRQCLLNCWARPHCKAVNYRTTRGTCEIIDDDTGVTVDSEAGPCANVRRDDIFGIPSMANSSCYPGCSEYHVCDTSGICRIQGCPKLSLPGATVHGNIRTVGARVTIACMNGTTSVPSTIEAVCRQDGLWLMFGTLECRAYCDQIPVGDPNSSPIPLGGGSNQVEYRCSPGYVIASGGALTGQTRTYATCNAISETWTGLDFTCVWDNSLGLVQVSNMTLRIVENSVYQFEAEEECNATGQLLKLDTLAKLAEIQAYLAIHYNHYYGDDIWVQGRYVDLQWTFDNGDAMPTDTSVWYDNDGSFSCVVLDASSNFKFNDRSCTDRRHNYICEIL